MTDESTPEALKTVAENVAEDVVKDTPSVIAHLKAYGEWTKEEVEAAFVWLKDKL